MLDPYKVREDFPILKRKINGHPLIYFDSAATSQKPRQVIEAVKDYYENHNANVHRAIHTLSQEASQLYEDAHEEVAQFINAKNVEETIFLRGTTEAINLVAYSLGCHTLQKDDEVVVTLMEHHSNIIPWEIISKTRGFKLRYADINSDGTLDYEALGKTISDKTKIVCFSHVSNVTGVVNDVKRIARVVHEHGALALVDGAQSVPHMPIDVEDLDVDFFAFSGHKMLAPTGIGVLYGKSSILQQMEPFQGGGEMIKEMSFDSKSRRCSISWNDLPWKFEAGTPNISGGVGLLEAVRYLKRLGMENVKAHEFKLTEYAIKRLQECEKITIYGPKDPSGKSGIIPFGVEGLSSHDVALFLDNYGIMVRSGFHCAQPLHKTMKLQSSARASFYVYNTREEIDRFVEVLKGVSRF
jgi:cysteine desulfurase/selenocysteine lyase